MAELRQVAAFPLGIGFGLSPLANRGTPIGLDVAEPANVLVMGLPRNFHYGPGMGTNPILVSLAIGGQLCRCWRAFREGGVIIAASLCDGWFNDTWFPSYQATYETLQDYCDAADFLASERAGAISMGVDFCFKYINSYTHHPFHAMSMISGGSVLQKRTTAVFIASAKAPRYARGMGFIPTNTCAETMQWTERLLGRKPRILCAPEALSGGVAVHLQLRNG